MNIAFEKHFPQMTPEDFEKFLEPIVMEYFEHGDSADVIVSLCQHFSDGVNATG